jgi:hypothetical protein
MHLLHKFLYLIYLILAGSWRASDGYAHSSGRRGATRCAVAHEDKMTKLFMAGHVETQDRSDQIIKTVMFALFLRAQNRFLRLLIEIKWFLLVLSRFCMLE